MDQETPRALGTEGPAPLYHRLRAALRARIESGELPPGAAFPTENELIAQYGVSRTTVREAIGGLVYEGLVHRKQGKGTFVAARRFERELGTLTGFSEEIAALGMRPGARLLSINTVPLRGRDAELLGLPAGSAAYRIVRLRLADGEPLSIETATFPFDVGFRIAQENLSEAGYYPLLEERWGIRLSAAEQTIGARPATAEQARLLGMRRGAATLVLERVTTDISGRRIELTRSVYRADRCSYRILLRR